MDFLRTILGSFLGTAFNLLIFRFLPFTPDLTDWGGRAFPRSYILPLLIVAIVSYAAGWIAAKPSPSTGRLCGMLASVFTIAAIIGWDFGANVLKALFYHPAYPLFSDHALLALAVLLVAGHLGGLRVEKSYSLIKSNEGWHPDTSWPVS